MQGNNTQPHVELGRAITRKEFDALKKAQGLTEDKISEPFFDTRGEKKFLARQIKVPDDIAIPLEGELMEAGIEAANKSPGRVNIRISENKRTSIWENETMRKLADKYRYRYEGIAGMGQVLTTLSERFDILITTDKRALKKLFTREEFLLMLNNALSTAYAPPAVLGAVLASTEDEIDEVFEHFGVDKQILVDKLETLSTGEQFALVDWLCEERAKVSAKGNA